MRGEPGFYIGDLFFTASDLDGGLEKVFAAVTERYGPKNQTKNESADLRYDTMDGSNHLIGDTLFIYTTSGKWLAMTVSERHRVRVLTDGSIYVGDGIDESFGSWTEAAEAIEKHHS